MKICNIVLKNVPPELSVRACIESKADLNLTSLSNILRAHFRESNSRKFYTELSNLKQTLSESAYEHVVRLMSLRQKISAV